MVTLQVGSSLFSFVKVITNSQVFQVRKIGRIQEAPSHYYALYFLWSTWIVFSKTFLLAYVFHSASTKFDVVYVAQVNGLFQTLECQFLHCPQLFQLALLFLLLPLNVLSHWRAFGRRRTLLLDALLSTFVPANFVDADRDRTLRFLSNYGLAHYGVFMAVTYLKFATGLWDGFVYISVCYHILFGISLILISVFCHYGLDTLYEGCHLSYPHMKDFFVRRSTFPPDKEMFHGNSSGLTFDQIALKGHFYSDPRLRRLITTCYECGLTRCVNL